MNQHWFWSLDETRGWKDDYNPVRPPWCSGGVMTVMVVMSLMALMAIPHIETGFIHEGNAVKSE